MRPLPAARRNALDWLIQLAYTTWRLFKKNELTSHAAATALYFLLSATPLLLLLSYAMQGLAHLAETSVPATMLLAALYEQFHLDALTDMGFIPQQLQLAAGGVGLVTLALSSRGMMKALQGALGVIFPAEAKRRFVLNWSLPLVVIPVAFLLVGLAVAAQGVLSFFAQVELLGTARATLLQALNFLLALVIVWALIFAAYWRLPRAHPPARLAALVALLSALSLFALFAVFGQFFQVEKYRAVYGALGGVVFVLMATYFACVVFYAWAQCLYALGKVDVAALERLFLGSDQTGADKLEDYVFGRAGRLLDKYGHTLAPGEVVITEGDTSQTAFFLYSGRVGLYKRIDGQDRKLGTLEQGELFGEMAYLLGERRSATVTAEVEAVVLALPPELLEDLMRYSAPLSRRIISTLCQRLMRMNVAQGGG